MSQISFQSGDGTGTPMLPAAAGVGSDVEQGVPNAEDEPEQSRPKHLSDKPQGCLKKMWPAGYGWLEAAGYDHALIVQDKTHASIYISSFISFFFSAMWLVDVFTLGCFANRANDYDIGGDTIFSSVARCTIEFLGGLIFFASLRDSIVMLGNYDNEHRSLMDRKNELMAELQTDITQALSKAKENADQLYGLLFEIYKDKVQNYVQNIFESILPNLCDVFLNDHHHSDPKHQREREQDLVKLNSLVDHLGSSLAEPAQLSAALCRTMPDVYSNFKAIMPNIEATAHTLEDADGPPMFWVVLVEDSDLSKHLDGTALVRSADHVSQAEREKMKDNPQEYVFSPVKKMVTMLEGLLNSSKGLTTPQEEGAQDNFDHLVGVGAPPWSTGEEAQKRCLMCCCPRLFMLCMFRCCCCCLCCAANTCTMYNNAMKYPKRFRFGFVWFQVVSKLHERLIQGIVLCCFVFAFYFERVFVVLAQGNKDCNLDATSSKWWSCWLMELKRSALVLALFCHIVASLRCLVRIRDLDAVIKIMEDIRKLQGLRGIIANFSRTLAMDSDRQSLLDAVKVRVLNRITIVDTFRRHIAEVMRAQKQNQTRMKLDLREATSELIKYFAFSARTLKPASDWLKLKPEEQDEMVARVTEYENALQQRNFRPDLSASPSSNGLDSSLGSTSSLGSSTTQSSASSDPENAARKPARKLTPPMRAKKISKATTFVDA